MTADAYQAIRDLVYERCGIYFGDINRERFVGRVEERISATECEDATAYRTLLLDCARGKAEFTTLLDRLVIGETCFFRTMPQLDLFRNALLPDVIARAREAGRDEIRIWSAGCSSGEEPYSLAILARESLRDMRLSELRAAIYATDLSRCNLAQAQTARYGTAALRNVPIPTRDTWFSRLSGDSWEVKPEIRGMVTFEEDNLIDSHLRARGRDTDVIFCRNVMIYFEVPARERAINKFYNALRPNGFLVIGPSESLFSIKHPFKLVHYNRAQVYAKR